MNKKAILIPIIALTSLLTFAFYLSPIQAASPTPTASPSPSPSAPPPTDKEITDNLKKRLQESLDSETPTKPVTYRAFIGTVKDVIKDTVIIEDKDGKKDIKLKEETVILRTPGNATIKPENIRIDDYIIAIGDPYEDNALSGRRLLVSTEPIKVPEKTSGIGTISKITKSTITLKVEDKEQVLDLTSKTIAKSANGTIEIAELKTDDTIIYTAKVDDEDLTATILMRTKSGSTEE